MEYEQILEKRITNRTNKIDRRYRYIKIRDNIEKEDKQETEARYYYFLDDKGTYNWYLGSYEYRHLKRQIRWNADNRTTEEISKSIFGEKGQSKHVIAHLEKMKIEGYVYLENGKWYNTKKEYNP